MLTIGGFLEIGTAVSAEAKGKIGQLGFMVIGVIMVQIITGGLSLLNLPLTPILFIDVVATFGLMIVVIINLMGYVSIQFQEDAIAK